MALQNVHVSQKSDCFVLAVLHLLIRLSLEFSSKAGKFMGLQLRYMKSGCFAASDP